MTGANALEEDVRKLQHQKKHADTRITDHPSMREATINYDEPVVQNKSQSTNHCWEVQIGSPHWKGLI